MCGAQHVPVMWWYFTSRASAHRPGHLLRWAVIASQKFQPIFKSELFGSSAMRAMLVSEAVTTRGALFRSIKRIRRASDYNCLRFFVC